MTHDFIFIFSTTQRVFEKNLISPLRKKKILKSKNIWKNKPSFKKKSSSRIIKPSALFP